MLTHSIIILTKDRPSLLPRAVASARAALRAGGEIVVVDDASTIPARDILAASAAPDLHIVRREVSTGISAARNAGIAASAGSVIFFLDDDDEIMPHYPQSILDGPAAQFDYGFSNTDSVFVNGAIFQGKPRFASGAISPRAPLRKQLCTTCEGFWINRAVAIAIGPFLTELAIHEDAEFLFRLISQGRTAYYHASAGMMVHRHNAAQNMTNITSRITSADRAKILAFISERHPQLGTYFGRSYLRLCAKLGLHAQAKSFIRQQPRLHLRAFLAAYYATKRLLYALKSALLRSA